MTNLERLRLAHGLTQETTVDEVYGLYKKAAKELQKLDGKDFNNHVSSPDFSL